MVENGWVKIGGKRGDRGRRGEHELKVLSYITIIITIIVIIIYFIIYFYFLFICLFVVVVVVVVIITTTTIHLFIYFI